MASFEKHYPASVASSFSIVSLVLHYNFSNELTRIFACVGNYAGELCIDTVGHCSILLSVHLLMISNLPFACLAPQQQVEIFHRNILCNTKILVLSGCS